MEVARISLGVTAWSLDGRGPETVERAAALGFDTIHLDSGALDGDLRLDDDAVRERYRRASRACAVTIGAIAGGDLNDLGLTSPAGSRNAARCWDSIRIAIDAAAAMDVPVVFLPSFRAGEILDAAGLHRTGEVLAAACDYARSQPVTIASENTLSVAGNLRLLEAAARPELRILLDTQNPSLWGHPVAPMVDALWPYLAEQVHVKDGVDGAMGSAVLGEGTSDFAATAAALRHHGFDGALVSENDYHGARSANALVDLQVLRQAFEGADA
ncbi:MAG TPA: TIM barrel protein [Candidatus Limnocylindrales bacterium]|nr:TIM barrel protein [Candidatus Limnocylindrales bacterium]